MSYAGVIGQNFEIPLQQQVMPQVAPQSPQLAQGSMQGPKLEEGLYEVEGLTKEYYDKWTALNTWAEQMQSMGINVTKPDPLNPQSQAAHRWFMKATADLQRHGQALKQQSAIMKEYTSAKMGSNGQNISLGGRSGDQELISAMDIQNLGETDMVKRINTDLAKSTNDPQERATLQAQIDQKRGLLEQELAEMLQSGAPQQAILAKANEINQLNNATYNDTDRWKERQQNYRAKLDKEDPLLDIRFDLVQRVKNKEYSLLKANSNVEDVVEINTPRRKGIEVYYKGEENPEFIDFNDQQNIDFAINRAFDKGQESTAIGIDKYRIVQEKRKNDLVTPQSEDSTSMEDSFIDSLAETSNEDFRTYKKRDAARTRLNEVASKLIVPANVAGQALDQFVDKFEFGKGWVRIKFADKDGKSTGKDVTIDLNNPAGRRKFEELIDQNAATIEYKDFKRGVVGPPKPGESSIGTNIVSDDIPDFL